MPQIPVDHKGSLLWTTSVVWLLDVQVSQLKTGIRGVGATLRSRRPPWAVTILAKFAAT